MKKATKEQLEDFYKETAKIEPSEPVEKQPDQTLKPEPKALPYQCPKCHKLISSRKEPCKYCHYSGYIPMSEDETKKIRSILFFVILAIAIVVYIVTRY